jgi:hypothetical protein
MPQHPKTLHKALRGCHLTITLHAQQAQLHEQSINLFLHPLLHNYPQKDSPTMQKLITH